MRYYSIKKIVAILLASVLLYGCSGVADEDGILVRRVLDGDTIELANGARVRYLGVDTPETRKRVGREWAYSPEPYAEKATKLNASLVAGKRVKLAFDREKEDKYGRWLAFVYRDDVMVNKELLEAGLAMFVVYPPNTAFTEELILAQEKARQRKKGFWKDLRLIDPFEAYRYAGEICRVSGEVVSTGRSREAAYINFGERGSGALTAVIYSPNLLLFEKEGVRLRDYEGKSIRITGKVEDEYDPVIIVYHPWQIE